MANVPRLLFRRSLWVAALCAAATVACDRRVYVVDGATDGQSFYILPGQLANEDPVHQSWIAYSLARSTCQINRDAQRPARHRSFECELTGREALVLTWRDLRPADGTGEPYLDALLTVADAGFLDEYVWTFLHRARWSRPETLELESFEAWRALVLGEHAAQTRLIGAWI